MEYSITMRPIEQPNGESLNPFKNRVVMCYGILEGQEDPIVTPGYFSSITNRWQWCNEKGSDWPFKSVSHWGYIATLPFKVKLAIIADDSPDIQI